MIVLFIYLLGFVVTLAVLLYLKRETLTGFYARHVETEEIATSMLIALIWPLSAPFLLFIEAVRTITHVSLKKDDRDDR